MSIPYIKIKMMEVIEMEKTFLQVRTEKSDKEKASDILESLGTNLSTVVNMLLKQIILTKSIPFEVKVPSDYSAVEVIEEVKASMAMEDMPLTQDDIELLKAYQTSTDSEKESIRNQLITELTEE